MNDSGGNATVELSGGEAIARMLQLHEVGPMFGMAGFQLLPFYDAVRELGLAHTLINDERSGAFMADAWARVTGRPGVCDATLGPGATNLLTSLTESLNAGIPLIASDFPLWRELIAGNDCGLLVDPLSPEKIAEAIDYLVTHPEDAERMGRNGRKAVLERYNWPNEEKKLLGFYERILEAS